MTREEAINLIKQVLPCLNIDEKIREGFVTLIPELKESEDEKVRKALIDGIRQIRCKNGVTQEQMLAWLEKQKEQKHPDGCFTCDEYKKGYEEGRRNGFTAGYNKAMKEVEQKEQKPDDDPLNDPKFLKGFDTGREVQRIFDEKKPAEWSDDYNEENLQIRFAFYTYKDDPSVIYLSNVFVEETSRNHGLGTRILKAAEKAAEAIGAITIRLKVKRDNLANAWYRKHGYNYLTSEGDYDWLEKNLEYMKPNKQEWSEEDEAMIKSILFVLESYVSHSESASSPSLITTYPTYYKEIDWLKSLRPQPHWKPSEEQMRAIFDASERNDKLGFVLLTLYNDLKKL